MAKRISPEIDMKIITDLSLGIANKTIAKTYGVSASYVSKVKTGKKKVDVYVPTPRTFTDDDIEAYANDVDNVIKLIDTMPVLVSEDDTVKYLKGQVKKCVLKIKMYNNLIKKYYEEEN